MSNLIIHAFNPVFDAHSKILILGTMPSPKSRENGFYYSHPKNRFWHVLSNILSEPLPHTVNDKKQFLLNNHIAVWDVLKSCNIIGASDNSIKNPVANDINIILNNSDISAIFTTGAKAFSLYNRLCYPLTRFTAIPLPSTSPANYAQSLDMLIEKYSIIKKYL